LPPVGGGALRRLVPLAALVAALAGGGETVDFLLSPGVAHAQARPNVVLLVTDDQRFDTLSARPTATSELAANGVTFANAFAVNPVCCPSRASILTGQWSHQTGVWTTWNHRHGGFTSFDDRQTLAGWLDATGYETLLAGKYLNGYMPGALDHWSQPIDHRYVPPGWDRWYSYWLRGGCGCPFRDAPFTDGTDVLPSTGYTTDVLAAHAVRFVEEAPRPFFLYLAPSAPHLPARPAERHQGAFAGLGGLDDAAVRERNLGDKPAWLRRVSPLPSAEQARIRRAQLESLLAVDDMVADLLEALADSRRLANTLFILTSDNGYHWGEHGLTSKNSPYEASLRVPLVMRWDAGGLVEGTVQEPALNVDLAQTIARAAGAGSPGASGRSLLPLLRGQRVDWRRRFLIEHHGGIPSYCGYRAERWKYVQYATGEEELYDLHNDPYELRNRAASGEQTAKIIDYRQRVRRSGCRPPGYKPLSLCLRSGTNGPDYLRGGPARDWLCAKGGDDRIDVLDGGRDTVYCGAGFDRVRSDRADILIGCERRGRTLEV
jgi:N-acetylglucosamine-6-sulfatase